MLTKKQRELLILIHERMQEGDVAPSFDEMRESLGLKSKSGIHRLITALEEQTQENTINVVIGIVKDLGTKYALNY